MVFFLRGDFSGASDCLELSQNYSATADKLKSIDGIKTKVLLDFNAIHEKFPCNQFVHAFLLGFVSISFLGCSTNNDAASFQIRAQF